MNKASNKKSLETIYLFSFSLSHVKLIECEVCINERGNLPIYTFQVTDLLHDWGWPLTLTRSNYPRDTPKLHYIILHLGNISSTYNEGCTSRSIHNNGIRKGGKHISDGGTTTYTNLTLEYISKVTNTSTLPLN